jgi:hypothetical protein
MDSAAAKTCRTFCSLTPVSSRDRLGRRWVATDATRCALLMLPATTATQRITEYENARLKSPQKPAEGPLFEIVKSNRNPDDKKSPIAEFPTGECSAVLLLQT